MQTHTLLATAKNKKPNALDHGGVFSIQQLTQPGKDTHSLNIHVAEQARTQSLSN